MDQGTLVNEAKEAGKDFLERVGKIRHVQVAFWLKAAERKQWHLYLALEGVDENKMRQENLELLKLAIDLRNPYLEPLQFKLIKADDPLARDVMDLNRLYPGNPGFYYNGSNLGGMGIDGAYIYPVSESAPVQTT